MPGTKAGGAKAAITNKAKFGEDYYQRLGREGGAAGTGHKFGHGKVDPAVIGALGGAISKRRARQAPDWSVADNVETSIAEELLSERRKSIRERIFNGRFRKTK